MYMTFVVCGVPCKFSGCYMFKQTAYYYQFRFFGGAASNKDALDVQSINHLTIMDISNLKVHIQNGLSHSVYNVLQIDNQLGMECPFNS